MEDVEIKFADGRPIVELDNLLKERMRWLGDTAERGLIATAINSLVSLRASTRIAKATTKDFTLEQDASLYPSFYSKKICVRNRSGKHHLAGAKVYSTVPSSLFKQSQVFRMSYLYGRGTTAYIIALSAKAAQKFALNLIQKRMRNYAGLARLAWNALLMKTGQGGALGGNGPQRSISLAETRAIETRSADGFKLSLFDDLKYAAFALKGGRGDIELALQKALNKTVSTINRKIPDGATWFGKGKIPTPFPEIRQRG